MGGCVRRVPDFIRLHLAPVAGGHASQEVGVALHLLGGQRQHIALARRVLRRESTDLEQNLDTRLGCVGHQAIQFVPAVLALRPLHRRPADFLAQPVKPDAPDALKHRAMFLPQELHAGGVAEDLLAGPGCGRGEGRHRTVGLGGDEQFGAGGERAGCLQMVRHEDLPGRDAILARDGDDRLAGANHMGWPSGLAQQPAGTGREP